MKEAAVDVAAAVALERGRAEAGVAVEDAWSPSGAARSQRAAEEAVVVVAVAAREVAVAPTGMVARGVAVAP